jgi:CBS domain-containing protein
MKLFPEERIMRVQDIMTPDLACCTRYAALTDVARLMRDRDCGAIPVVEDNSRKLIGIISDRDIIIRTLGHGRNPFHLMASDCMTEPLSSRLRMMQQPRSPSTQSRVPACTARPATSD